MKLLIQKSNPFFIAFLVISSVISSCKKDDDDGGAPFPPSGTTLKTSVLGTIKDTDGMVVSGVTVKLGTYTTISDARGNFQFINADVPKDRMVLVATKSGYFNCVRAKKTQSGEANYINLLMEAKHVAVNVAGVAGGVVNIPGGAQITFPANAFVDASGNAYTGTVKVIARHISPGDDNFEAIVPSGDLSGINLAGQTQTLYSLGMIEAMLTDNTGLVEVKLASGKTAELKFPIDPSQTSSAQSTIPMWHMNETTGMWQEEGEAVKIGNFFVGSVSHFSTWNCDYPGERTDIHGKVVDCNNNPVAGINVTINGFMNVTTDNSGNFTTWVPAGYVIECQVLMACNPILTANSPVQSITSVGGITNVVPPIVIPCATRILGSVKTCNGAAFSPAAIYCSWNGGNSINYSHDGNFDIILPEETYVNIQGTNLGLTGSVQILTGTHGTTVSIPNIKLCNQTNLAEFEFTLNNSTNNIHYFLNILTSNTTVTDDDGDGFIDVLTSNITGVTNPGNKNCTVYIDVHVASNNFYSLGIVYNMIGISVDSIGHYNTSFVNNQITSNKLIITDYGSPGSNITGIFEYDTDQSSRFVTNGGFNLIRNN